MRTPFRRKLRLSIAFLSFLLFPWTVNWLSPYLSVAAAWSGVVGGSVLVFAALLITAPFLGRSFCSWICPGGFAQEAVTQVRPKRPGLKWARVKWIVWTPWILALASGWVVAGVKSVVPGWTPGGTGPQDFFVAVGAGTLMATMVSLLMVGLALAFGRRGACHSVCWMAPFLILGRKAGRATGIPGLQLTSTPDSCIACGRCTAVCPMGVPIQALARTITPEHPECILCADCVDACPQGTLKWEFGR